MNLLENGCRYTDISVYPKNWKSPRASFKKPWYVWYRFHDPAYKKQFPDGYKKAFRGDINDYETPAERKKAVETLIDIEKALLKGGYNPITNSIPSKTAITEAINKELFASGTDSHEDFKLSSNGNIKNRLFPIDDKTLSVRKYLALISADVMPNSNTLIIEGLWIGLKRIYSIKLSEQEPQTRAGFKVSERDFAPYINDIGARIRKFNDSCKALGLENILLKDVLERHIIQIMTHCKAVNNYSTNNYNRQLSYLGTVFTALIELNGIASNPCEKVNRIKIPKVLTTDDIEEDAEVKDVLSDEDLKVVRNLKATNYSLYRVAQIFYHSGAREKEIMRVTLSQVDLTCKTPYFKVLVLKGSRNKIVRKPIKKIALPYWNEIIMEAEAFMSKHGCNKEDVVLFSEGLKPGFNVIREDQLQRRWKAYVQEKFEDQEGKGFYSLKSHNLTTQMDIMISAGMDIEKAEKVNSIHASHESTAMLKGVYDKKNTIRRDMQVIDVYNEL